MDDPFRKPRRAHQVALRVLPWLLAAGAVLLIGWEYLGRDRKDGAAVRRAEQAETEKNAALVRAAQAEEALALAKSGQTRAERERAEALTQADKARADAARSAAWSEEVLQNALIRIDELETAVKKNSGPRDP